MEAICSSATLADFQRTTRMSQANILYMLSKIFLFQSPFICKLYKYIQQMV
jgi:hypothetical protein